VREEEAKWAGVGWDKPTANWAHGTRPRGGLVRGHEALNVMRKSP
jgi:hypothetical protein